MARRPFSLPQIDDPYPDLEIEEGAGDGVGWWVPDVKHTMLAKWIDGTKGARKKDWQHLVLIDPFCGPARVRVKGQAETRPGGCAVLWLQSQRSGVPFTSVLVGDLKASRAHAAEQRLRAMGAPVKAFTGPANETVHAMKEHIPRGALVLAYLDPYNLAYLSFDIIREIAKIKSVDFAVHFSVYDMFRNVDMEFGEERARFDEAAPGWRQAIDAESMSKESLKQAFFEYWMKQIEALGFTFSESMPLVRGDRNAPLYRLACFSRHPLPNRVWADVSRPDTGTLF